ncbi:hypothetical protein AXE80_13920 [Wenyingzhuangia fucanilytica]|uniref:Uncharacterized protein n=1 Tax=Wenyingzhuangia fucanilytica TaxID=1790137 RepID=A0A1B1Y968_9FLAO|nr:hypothetical protein [Wenyingzhuangia fucanilytica]ANW97323.1 hypothetical protein AXE80_13920 [Wenyingzhuangia fucanilytica]
MKRLLFISIFALFLTSCIKDDDDCNLNYRFDTLPVESITLPSSFELNEKYDITINYNLPNSSHNFYQLYFEHNNKERIVAVISYVNEDVSATGPVINKDYTFKLTAAQEDEYIFKIWKGKDENDDDIYETFTVPVIDSSQN